MGAGVVKEGVGNRGPSPLESGWEGNQSSTLFPLRNLCFSGL
jgi:hypothetical protein